MWWWYDLLAAELRAPLFTLSALIGVAAPGLLFQTTSIDLRGAMRFVLALTVPMPVVMSAVILGLARLQRGMGCGNFAYEVMRDPAEYVAHFTMASLGDAVPWIAVASLLGACLSPGLLSFAQQLDRQSFGA